MARDSQTLGLDREEAVRFLAAAEAAFARDHALACLLILNGLRVSEACGAEVADLGVERAHRVLAVVGKGDQRTLVPLAPRTVRAIEVALDGRSGNSWAGYAGAIQRRGQRATRGPKSHR